MICSISVMGSRQRFCLICSRSESAYFLDEKGSFGLLCSFELMLVKCLL